MSVVTKNILVKEVCLPVLVFITVCFASCKKEAAVTPDGQAQMAMLDSVNKLRTTGCKCGMDVMPPVKPLIWNTALVKSADAFAIDMYTRNYFNHISPDGTSPIQRAAAAGYTGNTIGENIAKGYTSIGTVMAAWKASEEHCKAMMDPQYIEMGAYSYQTYWVQEFGK